MMLSVPSSRAYVEGTHDAFFSPKATVMNSKNHQNLDLAFGFQSCDLKAGSSVSTSHDRPRYSSEAELLHDTFGNTELTLRVLSGPALSDRDEMRRLFRQFGNISLGHLSNEISRLEFAGYKVGYMKQLYAMIWLRQTCQRSYLPVPRNQVYYCYNLQCEENHVSAMNPASFGKIVRVVFPHLETRRLGVRGETKTHYLCFSVNPKTEARASRVTKLAQQNPGQCVSISMHKPVLLSPLCRTEWFAQVQTPQSTCVGHITPSTQDDIFPTTALSYDYWISTRKTCMLCNCEDRCLPTNFCISMSNVDQQASRMIRKMMKFSKHHLPIIADQPLALPNIRCHLPDTADIQVGDTLAVLYRSHCISVIQSFKAHKEDSLLKHFSSFGSSLTEPVKKLLEHPRLALWIKECDWRMYQNMLALIAPLATQEIPAHAFSALRSVSQKLCDCISKTTKDKPFGILIVRLITGKIFCNLLERFLDLNEAASAAAACLDQTNNRNRMWYDYCSSVACQDTILKANIPPCAERFASRILESHIRDLLSPSTEPEKTWDLSLKSASAIMGKHELGYSHTNESFGERNSLLEKWSFLASSISKNLVHPCPLCVIQKTSTVWNVVLHRLTFESASSLQSWWKMKVFFCSLMDWEAALGGYMQSPSAIMEISISSC